MKTVANEEYCMDKLYTQSYQNLARNAEITSTLSSYIPSLTKIWQETQKSPALYLLMSLSTVQLTMQRFK